MESLRRRLRISLCRSGEAGNRPPRASQLVGYPTQFPSVSLLDWTTGEPNARYRVLELLHKNFASGIFTSAYISPDGSRKLLLINKRSQPDSVLVPGAKKSIEQHVDLFTGSGHAKGGLLASDTLSLGGLSVTVITGLYGEGSFK